MHAAGRRFVHVVLLGCTLSGPVTIVVPFTPGASTDTLARFEADVLQRALHQSFVVENRPGAGGEVGIAYAAKAAPDGYTLLHAPSVIALLPYLKKSISYNLADFDPVVLVGLTQFGLVVSPSLPVNSVQDLIALAKARAGALTYASAGIGTPHQIFAELFKTKTGVDIRHVPYRGTVPGLTDVASGNVSMEFTDLTPALPLIRAGSLKILAVLSSQRNPQMPDVPSVSETVPGYDAMSWQGFFARAGTSKKSLTSSMLIASRRSGSSRNGTPRNNSAPSSPRKAKDGARSSAPPASSCNELRNRCPHRQNRIFGV